MLAALMYTHNVFQHMQYHKFKGRMLLFVLTKAFMPLLSTPVSHVPLLEPFAREGGRRKYVKSLQRSRLW